MSPGHYVALAVILFVIGAVGVLIRRNAMVIFMCIELMLNAVNLAFVAFARQHGQVDGQVVAFFVMVVAAAEVVVGLAILMAMGAVTLLAFPGYALPWPLSAACIVGGLALVVGWWSCPRLVRLLPERNRFRHQVEHDLAPFWSDRRLLVRVSLLSLAFHLSQVGVQWFLARAAGTSLPFSYCMVMHPILSLMMALPVSIGGFGVREGGYLYFLTRLDIDDSIAVTMALLWWLMGALSGVVGAVVFVASGAELPRLRARTPARVRGAA